MSTDERPHAGGLYCYGVPTVARMLSRSGPMVTSGWEEQHGPMMVARATEDDMTSWVHSGVITQAAFDAWCDLRDEYRHGIPAPWSGLHQLIRAAIAYRVAVEDGPARERAAAYRRATGRA